MRAQASPRATPLSPPPPTPPSHPSLSPSYISTLLTPHHPPDTSPPSLQSGDGPIEPPRKSSAVLPESLIEGLADEQKAQLVALMVRNTNIGLAG